MQKVPAEWHGSAQLDGVFCGAVPSSRPIDLACGVGILDNVCDRVRRCSLLILQSSHISSHTAAIIGFVFVTLTGTSVLIYMNRHSESAASMQELLPEASAPDTRQAPGDTSLESVTTAIPSAEDTALGNEPCREIYRSTTYHFHFQYPCLGSAPRVQVNPDPSRSITDIAIQYRVSPEDAYQDAFRFTVLTNQNHQSLIGWFEAGGGAVLLTSGLYDESDIEGGEMLLRRLSVPYPDDYVGPGSVLGALMPHDAEFVVLADLTQDNNLYAWYPPDSLEQSFGLPLVRSFGFDLRP